MHPTPPPLVPLPPTSGWPLRPPPPSPSLSLSFYRCIVGHERAFDLALARAALFPFRSFRVFACRAPVPRQRQRCTPSDSSIEHVFVSPARSSPRNSDKDCWPSLLRPTCVDPKTAATASAGEGEGEDGGTHVGKPERRKMHFRDPMIEAVLSIAMRPPAYPLSPISIPIPNLDRGRGGERGQSGWIPRVFRGSWTRDGPINRSMQDFLILNDSRLLCFRSLISNNKYIRVEVKINIIFAYWWKKVRAAG